MSDAVISLVGTRAYTARRLRRICSGRTSLTIQGTVMLALGIVGFLRSNPWPLLLFLFLWIFVRHALQRFIVHELENEDAVLDASEPLEECLSAELIASVKNVRHISARDLFEAALRSPRGAFLLDEMDIRAEQMMQTCADHVGEQMDIRSFLEHARTILAQFHERRITSPLVLYLLFSHIDCCREILRKADLSDDELQGLLRWESFHDRFRARERLFDPQYIMRRSSLGRSWVAGYTDLLDELTREIDAQPRDIGEKSEIIHRIEIDAMLRTFNRNKQRNVLLLGKPGVGKHTLVENVARALRAQEMAQHASFTRVLELQTEKLLSGVGKPDTFFLHALARAQRSGHFILVIKDINLLLQSADANLKAVFLKCLDANNMTVIAIADVRDYHSLIKNDPSIDMQFEKITVSDATDDETMIVLMAHYFALSHHRVHITYKALKAILDLSKRYLSAGGLPGRAVDVMDDAILHAAERKESRVTEAHVREVISTMSKVNVQRVDADERERLLTLEDRIKAAIIDQDNAVRAVVSALKRARMDLHDRKKPVGTFLFLGPTGVGKTQTAKVLAEQYFGASDAMIRLDMNEYSHADSVFGIIGSAQAGSADSFLSQRVQDHPFSLILLDEIEKAHPAVLNLFLQILDEGFLSDARGLKTDFRNTIIIATSNAGALFIRDFIKAHPDFDRQQLKNDLIETVLKEKLFTPEFVNRFDEIVLFYPLTQEGAREVAMLMLGEIIAEVQKRRGITVELEEDVLTALIERGYSAEFGAREMRRTITEIIEDYLADYFLKHDVERGATIRIRREDIHW